MKKIIVCSTLMWTLWSCQKTEQSLVQNTNAPTLYTQTQQVCGDVKIHSLIAGQHHMAGSVIVRNDADSLYITYEMANTWELRKTHLYTGDCNAMPTNKGGNPQNGQFPYKSNHPNGTVTYTYSIPLGSLPSCFCIAAHAEVVKKNGNNNIVQSETAWGEGSSFPGNNWAMYFDYCKQACDDITPPNE